MAENFNYRSVLAPYFYRLVDLKVAVGQNVLRLKWILKEFDDFAMTIGLESPNITQEFIEDWRKTRIADADITLYIKYCVWSQLTKMMARYGVSCFIPQLPKLPSSDFEPYIFTEEQMACIFGEVDKYCLFDIRMGTALISMPPIIRLLYASGARISEVLSIKNADVNLSEGFIVIHKTKNRLERIIALKDSMIIVLKQYVVYRNQMPVKGIDSPDRPFFVKTDGTAISSHTVYDNFRKILDRCGIPHIGNHHGPRIHDLRHTYAVHSLAKIVRAGYDVYVWLPALSASLGHKSLVSTEKYVRLTKALYPDVSEMCSELNKFIFPEYGENAD